jgi:hypothetical protein
MSTSSKDFISVDKLVIACEEQGVHMERSTTFALDVEPVVSVSGQLEQLDQLDQLAQRSEEGVLASATLSSGTEASAASQVEELRRVLEESLQQQRMMAEQLQQQANEIQRLHDHLVGDN